MPPRVKSIPPYTQAETAMNQKLLAAKGALFVAAIAYFAFTSL